MADAAAGASKTIYLIRHAESEQNVAMLRLRRGEASALPVLARLGLDAPLSAHGVRQVEGAPRMLAAAGLMPIGLVANSPYVRARDTAAGLFSEHQSLPRLELPWLYERTLLEYINSAGFDRRIAQLRPWLATRPEQTIALVGHGQFFKRLLGRAVVQPNLSALECKFDGDTLSVVREVPLAGEDASRLVGVEAE